MGSFFRVLGAHTGEIGRSGGGVGHGKERSICGVEAKQCSGATTYTSLAKRDGFLMGATNAMQTDA